MVRGLPQKGDSPAIKTLTSYYTVVKGQPLQAEVLFFNESGSQKHSEKLPADSREYDIVGLSAHHTIRFAGATNIIQDQTRLAYERATRFKMEIGEELIVDCTLADLLNYESVSGLDGTVSREVRQMGGLKLDPTRPRTIVPNVRTVIQIIQPTMLTLDTGETVAIPSIVGANEYYLQLNIDTDATAQ